MSLRSSFKGDETRPTDFASLNIETRSSKLENFSSIEFPNDELRFMVSEVEPYEHRHR